MSIRSKLLQLASVFRKNHEMYKMAKKAQVLIYKDSKDLKAM